MVQWMRVWLREDIGIPAEFQRSPRCLKQVWRGELLDGPEPPWTSRDMEWSIMARDVAVLEIVNRARDPLNTLSVRKSYTSTY